MAAVGRQEENESVDQNIYDNNAKEINPQMVRDALKVIIDSNFNLVDDLLSEVRYDETRTLAQALPTVLWGSTGSFDVAQGDSEIPGGDGIVSSASIQRLSTSNSELTISLSENISGRKLSVQIFTDDQNMNANNDICSPTIRVVSGTNIRVGLREVDGDVQNIRLEVLAFKIEQ